MIESMSDDEWDRLDAELAKEAEEDEAALADEPAEEAEEAENDPDDSEATAEPEEGEDESTDDGEESVAAKPEEAEQPEADTSNEVPRVPVIEVTKARRQRNQAVTAQQKTEKENEALRKRVADLEFLAEAEGVDLTATSANPVPMSVEEFKELRDAQGDAVALAARDLRAKQVAEAEQAQARTVLYTQSQVDAAIEANHTVSKWMSENGQVWQMACDVYDEIDQSKFASADDVMDEVERITTQRVAERAKAAVKADAKAPADAQGATKPSATRSLSDQPNEATSGNSSLDALESLEGEAFEKALAKYERDNPEAAANALF